MTRKHITHVPPTFSDYARWTLLLLIPRFVLAWAWEHVSPERLAPWAPFIVGRLLGGSYSMPRRRR